MRGRSRNKWFLFLPILLGIIPFSARGYHIDTHALLTNEAFDFYNEHFDADIKEDVRAFLIDGARREDDPPRWMNHFYDPVNNRGFSYDPLINPEINVGNWQKSKEWAEDRDNQNKLTYKVPATIASILSAIDRWKISEITAKTDFTWQEAVRHYVNGNSEKAFFTLGHILHLIQDVSVPDHTRNDPHPEGSPYEIFAEGYNLSNPDEDLKARLKDASPISYENLGDYFDALATYSNNNFYSKDTIGIQTGYSLPDLVEEERKGDYLYGKARDDEGEYILYFRKPKFFTLLNNNEDIYIFSEKEGGDIVLKNYWSRLSTKSVQFSAGIIDLFFKDVEKAKNDPNFERGEEQSLFGKIVDVVNIGIQEVGLVMRNIISGDTRSDSDKLLQSPETSADENIDNEDNLPEDIPALLVPELEEEEKVEPPLEEEILNNKHKEIEREEKEEKKDNIEEEVIEPLVEKTSAEQIICAYDERKISKERKIILNEIAWMGREEGYTKEWFELKNVSSDFVSLLGWQIVSIDNDIEVVISDDILIAPEGFLLFERTNDDTVPDVIADGIYSGNLSNDGTKNTEGLRVFDASCVLHDEALAAPWWLAGDNKGKRTMERNADRVGWHTSSVVHGTPKKENSAAYVPVSSGGGSSLPAVRTYLVKIHEIMYDAPGSDEGKEWIEIKNEDTDAVDINTWKVYESGAHHSLSVVRGTGIISPGEYAVIADDADMFLSDNPSFSGTLFDSAYALSNDGESIAIKNGTITINEVSYASSTGARGDGKSIQKINGVWNAAPPTPGAENILPNEYPQVDFSITPSEPIAGDFVHFESLSSDRDGEIVNLYWMFGDGMLSNGASSSVTHMYAQDGFFEATLTATDDDGAIASSSRVIYVASSSATTSPAMHVVISEILFDGEGSDEGKEFVELYNPTDSEIDIRGWSFDYFIGNATTGVPLATIGSSASDNTNIPARGFFLLGLNGYNQENFQGTSADAIRSKSIPNGSDRISVALFDAADNEIDKMRYTSDSIAHEGQSVERKTVVGDTCTSARGSDEYSGNTCDRGSDGDFESRSDPRPQNSQNLLEPRERLSVPGLVSGMSSIGSFEKNILTISFVWSASTSSDLTSEVWYSIVDVSSSTSLAESIYTTSTNASITVDEVGRSYTFEIYAEDVEGFESEKKIFEVSVPSFFDVLYAYPDPRDPEGGYIVDMYWNEFPFIPQNKGGNGWQAILLYKNKDASKDNGLLSANEGYAVPLRDGILQTQYESCATDTIGVQKDIFVIPLGSEWCSAQGGGLFPEGFHWDRLEDNHAIIKTSSLTSGDYISVGYYDRNGFGHFELSAIDVTRWQVQAEKPSQYPPILSDDIQTVFSDIDSKLTLTLPQKSDNDTLDRDVVYELNFSPLADGVLNETLWNATSTAREYARSVLPNDAFLIGVRARDDFGNLSGVATTTWEYPSTQFPIAQTQSDDFGISFGTTQFSSMEADTASFQSIVPESDLTINTVIVKLRQYGFDRSYTARPRITFLANAENNTPDFSTILGESRIADLLCREEECFNEDKIFSFSPALTFHAGEIYWLVLDAEYDGGTGYLWHTWRNATQSGGTAYQNGIGGSGHYRGQNAACGDAVMCDFSPNENVDWYMKIGTKGD